MKSIQNVISMLNKNKYEVLIAGIFLQILVGVVGITLLKFIFSLILLFSNQNTLEVYTIGKIFLNPFVMPIVLIYITLVAFIMLFEYTVLVLLVSSKKISYKKVLKNSLIASKEMFGIQLLFFVIYLVSIIPFNNLFAGSYLLNNLYIPDFIMGELLKMPFGQIWYYLLIFAIMYVNFRIVYVFPIMILKKEKMFKSIKESFEITKTGKIKLIAKILISIIILALTFTLIFLLISLPVILFNKLIQNIFTYRLIITIGKTLLFIFFVFTKITMIALILNELLNKGKLTNLEVIYTLQREEDLLKLKNAKLEKNKKILVLSVVIISLTIFTYLNLNYEINDKIEVVAHRGFIEKGVENTEKAIVEGKKAGADYVEIDIFMTKDGKFVLSHDDNLKRLARINKKISESTQDELKGIRLYQGPMTGDLITFEDALTIAKRENIKLFIELKTHGKESKDYVEEFLKIVEKEGKSFNHKIISLNLNLLESLNQIKPDLEVGYIIPIMFGKISEKNVDFYVVEDFSYSEDRFKKAISKNKKIYVWTINDPTKIRNYLNSKVSGIISDNLLFLKRIKEDKQQFMHSTILNTIITIITIE